MDVELKICGITRREDALFCENYADYLGFVLVPGSPRAIHFDVLKEFTADLYKIRVAVLCNPYAGFVRQLLDEHIVDIVQLHGNESADFARQFDRKRIWKAVHLRSREELTAFRDYPAGGMLLDAARGGSGTTCDWELAREAAAIRPVILAGGITCDNLVEGYRSVNPAIIDIAGGSEAAPGIKSHEKIIQLAQLIQEK